MKHENTMLEDLSDLLHVFIDSFDTSGQGKDEGGIGCTGDIRLINALGLSCPYFIG